MAITKNKEEVRLKSGNNFKVYHNSAWITLGNIISGKITKQSGTQEIKFADGESFEKKTSRKCMLEIVLAQVSKEILDTIDDLLTGTKKLYYYNGVGNSKHMELYAPEAECIENLDFEMKADSHQTVALKFSLYPQSTNASVTPNTDLPSDKYATGGTLVTGTNPYYVLLETTVS